MATRRRAPLHPADDKLLTDAIAAKRYGLMSPKMFDVWEAKFDFPTPVYIGARKFRRLSDLLKWEAGRSGPAARARQLRRWHEANGPGDERARAALAVKRASQQVEKAEA